MFSWLISTFIMIESAQIVQRMVFRKNLHIKRDDLLISASGLSGNKARKFKFLEKLFVEKSSPQLLVSYGGLQSNAMAAISSICHHYNSKFIYMTKNIPKFAASGNYATSIEKGMKVLAW